MTDKEVIKIAQGLISDFKTESDTIIDFCNVIIKTFEQKQKAAVWRDFYVEDDRTWPPVDQKVLIQNHVGDNFSNYIAYLEFDDEDGNWGFYSEDGDFIADLDEIDAWMPIPQHERDKNYIPVWKRKDLDSEEEKDR